MGVGMEANIFNQLRKGQGETNDRLDRLTGVLQQLLAEQQRTNQWLAALAGQPAPAAPAPDPRGRHGQDVQPGREQWWG